MAKNENARLMVNRIVAFLAGGLLMFAVMSFTVVNTAKTKNAELAKELDVSRYEAGRLLADAKDQLASKDFRGANSTLAILFEKQPGSAETVEGRKLLSTVNAAEKKADAKWEAAMAGVQKKWANALIAGLRAESDKNRAKLETDMNETVVQEWEKVKTQVRADWENQTQL